MGSPVHPVVVRVLRVVIGAVFLVILLAQCVLLPAYAGEAASSFPEAAFLRWPVLVLAIAALVPVQVALVCIWRLLTMVREDTVFSRRAFRYVDVVIGAAASTAGIAVALIVLMETSGVGNVSEVPLTLAAVVAVGIALLVVVLRALLAKAVALDDEARSLHAELDEVI